MTNNALDPQPGDAAGPAVEVGLPTPDQFELTEILHALSDPIRLHLVRVLDECGDERTCGSFDLPIAKSTATHHWRVLRDAGLVSAREAGTKKYHRLRRAEVDARFPGLLDSVIASSRS